MADPVPEDDVDLERANAARMDDYLLGGAHKRQVDRETAHGDVRIRTLAPLTSPGG